MLAALAMPGSGTAGEGVAAEVGAVQDPRDADLVELARTFLQVREIAADASAHFLATADDLTIDEHTHRYDAIYDPYKAARDRLFAVLMEGAVESRRPFPCEFDYWTCLPARAAVLPDGRILIAYSGGCGDPIVNDETTIIVIEAEDVVRPAVPTQPGSVVPQASPELGALIDSWEDTRRVSANTEAAKPQGLDVDADNAWEGAYGKLSNAEIDARAKVHNAIRALAAPRNHLGPTGYWEECAPDTAVSWRGCVYLAPADPRNDWVNLVYPVFTIRPPELLLSTN